MARKYFIYNSDTYRYEAHILTKQQKLNKLGWTMGGAAVLTALFLALNYWVLGDISKGAADNLNKQLADQMMDLRLQLQKMDLSIEKIHKNDQSYFRSILNLPKITTSEWEAGFGGSEQSIYEGKPNYLRQTLILEQKLNHKFSLQKQSFRELATASAANQDQLSKVPTLRPLKGRILSGFGYRRDPISGGVHFHPGLDLDARYGEPIHAVAEGTVIEAGGSDGGYGIQVEIDHGYGYVTKYAHMSKLAVKPGQKVKRKDVIGYVGNTGYSVGAHLHYEVIRYGNKIDPRDYILAD